MTGIESEFRYLERFYTTICLFDQENSYGIRVKATPRLGGYHYNNLEGFNITLSSFHDCERKLFLDWGAIQLMIMNEKGMIGNEFTDWLLKQMEELDKEDYMRCGF